MKWTWLSVIVERYLICIGVCDKVLLRYFNAMFSCGLCFKGDDTNLAIYIKRCTYCLASEVMKCGISIVKTEQFLHCFVMYSLMEYMTIV